MRTDYLVEGFGEHEVADLRADVHGFDGCAGEGISEFYCSVCCASA